MLQSPQLHCLHCHGLQNLEGNALPWVTSAVGGEVTSCLAVSALGSATLVQWHLGDRASQAPSFPSLLEFKGVLAAGGLYLSTPGGYNSKYDEVLMFSDNPSFSCLGPSVQLADRASWSTNLFGTPNKHCCFYTVLVVFSIYAISLIHFLIRGYNKCFLSSRHWGYSRKQDGQSLCLVQLYSLVRDRCYTYRWT